MLGFGKLPNCFDRIPVKPLEIEYTFAAECILRVAKLKQYWYLSPPESRICFSRQSTHLPGTVAIKRQKPH